MSSAKRHPSLRTARLIEVAGGIMAMGSAAAFLLILIPYPPLPARLFYSLFGGFSVGLIVAAWGSHLKYHARRAGVPNPESR